MKLARLAVFGIAIVAAAGAGFVAVSMTGQQPSEPIIITAPASEPTVQLVEILATGRAIAMGESVADALVWRNWPKDAVGDDLILRETRPEAIGEIGRSVARQSFFSGEPVREAKLVQSDRGFLSAILPSGRRAVAVRIAAETAAGGFILPNDHVDVIMAREVDGRFETETILRNLRVLAIDQTIEEQDGASVVVGSTATMEVDPTQAEALTAAQRMSDTLILSLRAMSDSTPGGEGYARFLLEQEQAPERTSVRLVRYGQTTDVVTRN